MTTADRRTFLRFAAIATLLPLMAPAVRAHGPAPPFAPPLERMRYTRRLMRGLADGKSLVVSRSFEVRFLVRPGGYRVEGEQVAVQVDAPEALAAFARIEREREEHSLFPLLLDPAGHVTGTLAARAPMAARLDDALREATARIDALGGDEFEREERLRFVNAIHQSAGQLITQLPHDLFAPAATPRTESRELELPGGATGEVTVTFSAIRDPATGLMRQATREVVTELGKERRQTVESWRLDLLAA